MIHDPSSPPLPRPRPDWRSERPVTFTKYTVYHSTRDSGDMAPLPGVDVSFDSVAAASGRAWAKRWKSATIEIDGDPTAERGVRFAAFQLIGAAPFNDPGAGMGPSWPPGSTIATTSSGTPTSLSSPTSPPPSPTCPESFGYRFGGLDGARAKAKDTEGGCLLRLGIGWEMRSEVTPEWNPPESGPAESDLDR